MVLLNSNKYWRIYFALYCFISLLNCKQKVNRYKFEITIDYGDSYKIDLVNKNTLFFRGKPPVEINISLSIVEELRQNTWVVFWLWVR